MQPILKAPEAHNEYYLLVLDLHYATIWHVGPNGSRRLDSVWEGHIRSAELDDPFAMGSLGGEWPIYGCGFLQRADRMIGAQLRQRLLPIVAIGNQTDLNFFLNRTSMCPTDFSTIEAQISGMSPEEVVEVAIKRIKVLRNRQAPQTAIEASLAMVRQQQVQ